MSGEIKLDPRKALRKSTCGEVKLKRTRPRDDLSVFTGRFGKSWIRPSFVVMSWNTSGFLRALVPALPSICKGASHLDQDCDTRKRPGIHPEFLRDAAFNVWRVRNVSKPHMHRTTWSGMNPSVQQCIPDFRTAKY